VTAILAIDQGTTSTKAMLVPASGEAPAVASVPVRRAYPRPGRVEQDPLELWRSVLTAVGQLPVAGLAGLAGVAVTSQRESVVVWDRRTGEPLAPCVSWQCGRGAEFCDRLRADGAESLVREISGLPLDPMFSAAKLRHLLDSNPALRAAAEDGTACAGTVDSWLVWNLSGGALHVTDAGNASRTLLFDLRRLCWSEELLDLFGLPAAFLPRVVPSFGVPGETVRQGPLPCVPITAVTADSHAALYGLGCVRRGTAKATYGTGTSVMSPLGPAPERSGSGLAATVAWLADRPAYALEGNATSSGATVDWLARLLGLAGPAAVEALAATVPGAGDVHIVPAFAGLGAPYWRPAERGRITGLTFASGPAEVARAAIESIAFQVADLVRALERDIGGRLTELRADGAASRNDLLIQFQADLLGCPVVRGGVPHAAARGAAMAGGVAAGLFSGDDVGRWPVGGERIEPRMTDGSRADLLDAWHEAVGQAPST